MIFSMTKLRIEEVSKFYQNHTALDNISLKVEKNSVFGLAAKTSLKHIVNHGIERYEGCSIILSTQNMNSMEDIYDDIVLINKAKIILDG